MKRLFLACLFLITIDCVAAHKLPVYSNFWFTHANYQQSENGCLQNNYQYVNKTFGTAQHVASVLLANIAKHNDCIWQSVRLIEKMPMLVPEGFIGSRHDWDIISKSAHAPVRELWMRQCINANHELIDQKTVSIQPFYQCPKGSRFSIKYHPIAYGCDTKPDTCEGDVVGRLLRISLSGLGHVGITLPDENVLEVLNNSQVINIDHFEQFKKNPVNGFWGEKYGLKDHSELTLKEADDIIKAGIVQSQYHPQYTLTWSWHPGGGYFHYVYDPIRNSWERIYTMQNALFRCDSFVYYCYLAGAGLHIVSKFGFPDTPKTIFNRFLKRRTPPGGGEVMLSSHQKHQVGRLLSASSASEFNLKFLTLMSVFNQEKLNIRLVDRMTWNYIHNKQIPRMEKIIMFWQLARQYQSQEKKFGYLIDVLATLKPLQLIPEIIALYERQQNNHNQQKLLYLLNQSCIITNSLDVNNHMIFYIKQAQQFISEIIKTIHNPNTLIMAYSVYMNILPPSQVEKILPEVLKQIKSSEHEHRIQIHFNSDLEKIRLALSSVNMQETLLPKLLKNAHQAGKREKIHFAQALCFEVQHLPKHYLDKKYLISLKSFLLQNREEVSKNNKFDLKIPYCDIKANDLRM